MTLQCHPSVIWALVESVYGTSYWFSKVTLVLSCPVYMSKAIFDTFPIFWPKFQGVCFGVHRWYRVCTEQTPQATSNHEIISKNSNLCDHNPPTLQTDRRNGGRTDDFPRQYRVLRSIAW